MVAGSGRTAPEGKSFSLRVVVPHHDGVVLGARRQPQPVRRPLAVPHLVAVLVQDLQAQITIFMANRMEASEYL